MNNPHQSQTQTTQFILTLHTCSPEETQALGAKLGACLQAGDFMALCGPLGSGKTCFVQGLARGLSVAGPVTSPTFIIIRHHPGPVPLCHADAYRIATANELEDAGLTEAAAGSVVALEWAEKVPELWPEELYIVRLEYDNGGRRIELIGRGEAPAAVVKEVSDAHCRH